MLHRGCKPFLPKNSCFLTHSNLSNNLLYDQISVGDIVSCAEEDGEIAIGTIMDIEDDLGRLHVKVTTKPTTHLLTYRTIAPVTWLSFLCTNRREHGKILTYGPHYHSVHS